MASATTLIVGKNNAGKTSIIKQDEIVYHTYHGTKGLEFENVLIVIEDGFGSSAEDRVFIRKFLENYASFDEKMPIGEYKKARNLLYVAATRAIKNLRVIYEGESAVVRETLETIFNGETTNT